MQRINLLLISEDVEVVNEDTDIMNVLMKK